MPTQSFSKGDSLARPLLLCWVALIVYASLYPFAEWHPAAEGCYLFLFERIPYYWTWFDLVANVMGYAPLGFLLVLVLKPHASNVRATPWRFFLGYVLPAVLLGAMLSYSMEVTQCWLPRYTSKLDWITNVAGTALGAVIAWIMLYKQLDRHWHAGTAQLFSPKTRGAQLLLVLWPCALLFPVAVPFALGQVGASFSFSTWLGKAATMPIQVQYGATGLGLLLPILIAYSAITGWHKRLLVLVLCLLVGFGASYLAFKLGFDNLPYSKWKIPLFQRMVPLVVIVGLLLLPFSQKIVTAIAVGVVVAHLAIMNYYATTVYFTWMVDNSLKHSFIHFYGITRWLGLLWPWLALIWLVRHWLRPSPASVVHSPIIS